MLESLGQNQFVEKDFEINQALRQMCFVKIFENSAKIGNNRLCILKNSSRKRNFVENTHLLALGVFSPHAGPIFKNFGE
jgi:hypothetical protein